MHTDCNESSKSLVLFHHLSLKLVIGNKGELFSLAGVCYSLATRRRKRKGHELDIGRVHLLDSLLVEIEKVTQEISANDTFWRESEWIVCFKRLWY